MNSSYLMAVALVLFALAYRFYGKFLQKSFDVDSARLTPAHTDYDGVDYVPAKNWWILFGHHFSSICGAGPIVGPVLACAYWGWGISAVWVVLGAIWMGAVADFASLMMSVRERGQSIAHIAQSAISKKAAIYFSVFLWISLILVIAVFSIFAAKTLVEAPEVVVPSLGLIPTAVLIGWLLYRTKFSNGGATLIGLVLLILLLFGGQKLHVVLSPLGPLSAENLWIIILLIYCFIASVTPVQILLQPRDYLASFILFALVLIGVLGVFVVQPTMDAPFFTEFNPQNFSAAGPLWPMLFVTIACGAISGFHSLVSSGTTCKQLSTELHACRIGYGGMLMESLVGILVIIAVSAGLRYSEFSAVLKSGGPITAFSHGFAGLSNVFLGDYGKSFAILALNAFILTTLDSATRIARYLTTEVFGIKNMYMATFLVVLTSFLLAVTGKWNLLWPAFGAANQLIAGIALLIASCWFLARNRSFLFTLIPALIMLITTVAAFGLQLYQALTHRIVGGTHKPDWILAAIALLLIFMAISIVLETLPVFARFKRGKAFT